MMAAEPFVREETVSTAPRLRSIVAGMLLFLLPFAGCRLGELGVEKKASVTALFSEREHKMRSCLRELAHSYAELQDSILFVDKDSRIRVKPPTAPGCEPYHAHLMQRVGGEIVEQVFHQNDRGLIEIDLARFSDSESLVITSAAYEIQQTQVPARIAQSNPEAKPEGGIAPPYILSYRLLAADTASTVIPLQPFRYDIETPVGSLHVLPTSLNRMDQIITMIDPSRTLTTLMEEDPYVTIAKYDIAIVPRLTVEVLGTTGKVWERTGAWHMPTGLDRFFKPGEKPFIIRSDERELVSFAPPPEVEITLPQDVPATSAKIGAKFKGFTQKDSAKLVLSCVYPAGPKGGFTAAVQTHDIEHQMKDQSFTVGLDGLPDEAFPLTTSITHRLVQTWRLTGGRFEPQDPRGKVVLASIAPAKLRRGPASVIFARYASHYDFLLFFGHGSGKGRKSSLADSYYGSDDTPSPNVTPPPGGGGGGGNGGGGPIPPIILPPPPGVANGAGGAGGGFGGGGNSDCGCGARGAACPSSNPCRGGCGKNCRCAGGNGGNNSVTINLSCQGKEGCKHTPQCRCGPHSWSEFDCMNIIGGMARGAAETAWFGPQGGMAPCHVSTPVARLRVTYWGVGIQRIDVWYTVNVKFGPCTPGKPPPDKPPPPEKPEIPNLVVNDPPPSGTIVHMAPIPPGIPGGLTGGDVTTGTTGTTGNVPVTGLVNHPYNDPNLSVRGGHLSNQLGGMGQIGAWTILSTDVFSPTIFANLLTIQSTNATAFQNAYWSGGGENAFGNVGWNPNLASQWATPMRPPPPPTGPPATTGGTTSTPPPPPPGTTTGGQTGGTS